MVSKTFFAKSVCKKGDHKSANSALGGGTPKTIKKLKKHRVFIHVGAGFVVKNKVLAHPQPRNTAKHDVF